MSLRQQLRLTVMLALPAMLAQLSSIAMQYIDAAMVGHLGAEASASIGLVSTTLWLFWGTCSAITSGFSVQIAHRVGAGDFEGARHVLRQGLSGSLLFGFMAMVIGLSIAPGLPHWLGGTGGVCRPATVYFLVFVLALPLLTLNYMGGAALRCAGNMKVPSLISTLMCVLDCVFNALLIFPSRDLSLCGLTLTVPGAGLGVLGAALGTVLAEAVSAALMLYYLCVRQPGLRLWGRRGSFRLTKGVVSKAVRISAPMGLEHIVICGAQIAVTVIVAPLGMYAIAANGFAVVAESLCYMPGYGIGDAATTLTGQSLGAGRRDLVRRFAYISVALGMAVMSVMGVLMWLGAPWVMALLSPVAEIQSMGVGILRIEAWAEPMFAASIVAYGAFVGVGHTVVPAMMNFGSIWLVRVPLSAVLVSGMGLDGVWLAMCVELMFRGSIFLLRLRSDKWIPSVSPAG